MLIWLIAPFIILALYGNSLNRSRAAVVVYWLGKVLYSLAWGWLPLNTVVVILSIVAGLDFMGVFAFRSNFRRQTIVYILIDVCLSYFLWWSHLPIRFLGI